MSEFDANREFLVEQEKIRFFDKNQSMIIHSSFTYIQFFYKGGYQLHPRFELSFTQDNGNYGESKTFSIIYEMKDITNVKVFTLFTNRAFILRAC